MMPVTFAAAIPAIVMPVAVLSKLLDALMMMMSMTFATLITMGFVKRVAFSLLGKLTDMSMMPMASRGKFTYPFVMPVAWRMLRMVLGKMTPCVESIAARFFVVSLQDCLLFRQATWPWCYRCRRQKSENCGDALKLKVSIRMQISGRRNQKHFSNMDRILESRLYFPQLTHKDLRME